MVCALESAMIVFGYSNLISSMLDLFVLLGNLSGEDFVERMSLSSHHDFCYVVL